MIKHRADGVTTASPARTENGVHVRYSDVVSHGCRLLVSGRNSQGTKLFSWRLGAELDAPFL